MGGFAPLPTRLKVLRGIRPDRINHNEPQFEPGAPTPPAYLDHYGRTLWAEIVALLGPPPGSSPRLTGST